MDVAPLAVIAVAAVLGGAAQSVLGFGAAFTLVPALAVLAPEVLPGAAITAFLPLSLVMAVRERGSLDGPAAGRLSLARVPGTILGTAAVAVLPTRGLAGGVAVILLLAVLATARGWAVRVTPASERLFGAISGFSGTAVGLGGPPLALLYRGRLSTELRPTLAAVFAVGTLLSILTLAATGSYDGADLVAGSWLAAANVVGLVLAAPLLRRLPEGVLRAGLLWWAAVGAVLALVRVWWG